MKILKKISISIFMMCSINACTDVKNNDINNAEVMVNHQTNHQANQDYVTARNVFQTTLTTKAQAPQGYAELVATDDMDVVHYPSGDLHLQGLLETSNIKEGQKSPVLVYLHGGFALGEADIYDTQAFLDKGFVVFAPSYRGENGNEGNHELLMGEVDDAKSAVEWIAKQPFTDTDNIYVFGHSIGGGLSLHLSFFNDLPIKQAGSSSGLYRDLLGWDAPFDLTNKDEITFRLPLLNLDKIARKHIMYIGSEDYYFTPFLDKKNLPNNNKNLLQVEKVKGDHHSSLSIAMDKFLKDYYTPKK